MPYKKLIKKLNEHSTSEIKVNTQSVQTGQTTTVKRKLDLSGLDEKNNIKKIVEETSTTRISRCLFPKFELNTSGESFFENWQSEGFESEQESEVSDFEKFISDPDKLLGSLISGGVTPKQTRSKSKPDQFYLAIASNNPGTPPKTRTLAQMIAATEQPGSGPFNRGSEHDYNFFVTITGSPNTKQGLINRCKKNEDYKPDCHIEGSSVWTPRKTRTMFPLQEIIIESPKLNAQVVMHGIKKSQTEEEIHQYLIRKYGDNEALLTLFDDVKKALNENRGIAKAPDKISPASAKKIKSYSQETDKKSLQIRWAKRKATKRTAPKNYMGGRTSAGKKAVLLGSEDTYKNNGKSDWEYTHGIADSLGGANEPSNVFIATAASNTRMMLPEAVVRFLVAKHNNVKVAFEAEMFGDTDLAKSVDYTFSWGEKKITFKDINTLNREPPSFAEVKYYIGLVEEVDARNESASVLETVVSNNNDAVGVNDEIKDEVKDAISPSLR